MRFNTIISDYINRMYAQREYFESVSTFMNNNVDTLKKQVKAEEKKINNDTPMTKELINKYGNTFKIIRETEDRIELQLSGAIGEEFKNALNTYIREILKNKIMFVSTFISTVSMADYFLSKGIEEFLVIRN